MKSQQDQPAHTGGAEPVSGLNSSLSVEQARGQLKTGHEVEEARETIRTVASEASVSRPKAPQRWEPRGDGQPTGNAWVDTLKSSWQRVSEGVKRTNVSPTTLALGAAAVGAAVWLGTRKRTPKAAKQQTAADRWGEYPSGSGNDRTAGRTRGVLDQSNEPWQRPTQERWDD